MMAATLGIDIGTSSLKAIAFDPIQGELASTKVVYPGTTSDLVHLDAEAILHATKKAITELAKEVEIAGIGLSTFMHSIVLVDHDGKPITVEGDARTSVLSYADTRAADVVQEFKEKEDTGALYRATGSVLHPCYAIWKLAWLRKHDPKVLDRTANIMAVSEYVASQLTGEYRSSISVASTLGYLDINKLSWHQPILERFGISKAQLPELKDMLDVEPLAGDVARELGLGSVPVALGSGDGLNAHIGTNSMKPGMMTLSMGTTGAVRFVQPRPKVNNSKLWCHYLTEGNYVLGTMITSAGNCLEWLRDKFNLEYMDANLWSRLAKRLPMHLKDGMVSAPLISGERGPGWHERARGTWVNVSNRHDINDMCLAMLEGSLFSLYQCYQLLTAEKKPNEIRVTGGILNSPFWLQMTADIFNEELKIPDVAEPVAVAAALAAQKGIGAIKSFDESLIEIADVIEPDPQKHALYHKRFNTLYKQAYELATSV